MRNIKENDFAVVKDTERKMIVECGTFGHMQELAEDYNYHYQSKAYVAIRWIER